MRGPTLRQAVAIALSALTTLFATGAAAQSLWFGPEVSVGVFNAGRQRDRVYRVGAFLGGQGDWFRFAMTMKLVGLRTAPLPSTFDVRDEGGERATEFGVLTQAVWLRVADWRWLIGLSVAADRHPIAAAELAGERVLANGFALQVGGRAATRFEINLGGGYSDFPSYERKHRLEQDGYHLDAFARLSF
jgi:hypothetical protein